MFNYITKNVLIRNLNTLNTIGRKYFFFFLFRFNQWQRERDLKESRSRKFTLLSIHNMIFLARSRGCLCRKACTAINHGPETAIETLRRSEEISYSCKRKVQFEMEHTRRDKSSLAIRISFYVAKDTKSYVPLDEVALISNIL